MFDLSDVLPISHSCRMPALPLLQAWSTCLRTLKASALSVEHLSPYSLTVSVLVMDQWMLIEISVHSVFVFLFDGDV